MVFAPEKRVLIETRLGKRARALGLESLTAYCEYLDTEEGRRQESRQLIDAVTTHKTDYFREPGHFDYLTSTAVPELIRMCGAGVRQPLVVWSSACSTGEEPYTIAMVLSEFARSVEPQTFRFTIEATDISAPVLETARMAVYSEACVQPVPPALRCAYLLRSKTPGQAQVRVVPALRAAVTFRQLNLLESDYKFSCPVDVVFCRNVMIYFDRPTQEQILGQIVQTLRPGGYLMMGHAESLNGMKLPLVQSTPTVYRKRNG
jgi:chemotaxis protein methyltransferase CheR